MHSTRWVVCAGILLGFSAAATAEEKSKAEELEAIGRELKPLRLKAYAEPDVKAAREMLDAAYREYWEVVRAAMKRLDPSKAALIDREIALRQSKKSVATKD